MASHTSTDQYPLCISNLFDDFQQLAEASELFTDNPISRAGEFQMKELAHSIGERLLDRKVAVRELDVARQLEVRPIQNFWRDSGINMKLGQVAAQRRDGVRRAHPITRREYTPNTFAGRTKKVSGKVEAVDPMTASFVVKPGLFGGTDNRFWVRPVQADGLALVEFKKLS